MTRKPRPSRHMLRIAVDNTKGPNMPVRIMTLHQDDRLGWLYVPFEDLDYLQLTPYSFTGVSRIDEKGMYLEQEMDAEVFIAAYERKTGFRVVFNEVYEEPSPVREKQKNLISAIEKTWEKRTPVQRLRTISGP